MEKKNIDIQVYQGKCFELLMNFRAFCVKHDLKYWLSSGTLLGAVRHKNFIPWDDDIDIAMPRKDYEKLISIREKFSDYISVQNYELNNELIFPYVKVYDMSTTVIAVEDGREFQSGVWLDIFPIDGTFSNPFFRKLHISILQKIRVAFYSRFYFSSGRPISFSGRIFFHLIKFVSPRFIYKFLHFASALKSIESSRFLGCISAFYGHKEVMNKDIFGGKLETANVNFNNECFPAPLNPDRYLEHMYGDYMTLPPIDKRRNHSILFYDFKKPVEKVGFIE